MIPSYFKIEILAIQDEFVLLGHKGLTTLPPMQTGSPQHSPSIEHQQDTYQQDPGDTAAFIIIRKGEFILQECY